MPAWFVVFYSFFFHPNFKFFLNPHHDFMGQGIEKP